MTWHGKACFKFISGPSDGLLHDAFRICGGRGGLGDLVGRGDPGTGGGHPEAIKIMVEIYQIMIIIIVI